MINAAKPIVRDVYADLITYYTGEYLSAKFELNSAKRREDYVQAMHQLIKAETLAAIIMHLKFKKKSVK